MEFGLEPEKKKKAQESEDEMWARMDKRIERARAKHELARPGAPHWVVQSRFRVMCVGMSTKKCVCQNVWAELCGPNMCMLKVSFGQLKPTWDTRRIIHFYYTLEQF